MQELIDLFRALWGALIEAGSWLSSTLLGALIGIFIGERLALSRERRTEYNADAKVLRAKMVRILGRGGPSASEVLDAVDLDNLRQHLGWYDRRSLDKAVHAYEQTKERNLQADEVGQPRYLDTKEVDAALQALLKQIKRR